MTKERSEEVLALAIGISIVIHIGLMYCVKPLVMTSTRNDLHKARQHEIVRMDKRAVRPDPVKIAELLDEEPVRSAPEPAMNGDSGGVGGDVALAPEESPIEPPIAPPVPGAEGLIHEEPTSAPVFDEKPLAAVIDRKNTEPCDIVTFPVPGAATKAPRFETPSTVENHQALPVPAFAPPPLAIDESDATVQTMRRLEDAQDASVDAFVPSQQVYAEVDEKIVDNEKRAVRNLLASEASRDILRAVSVSAQSADDGKYTYFRVTVTPRTGEGALKSVPKDFVLLIDASGSIGKDRMGSIRKAAKALLRSATNTGDRFNLVAFRDRYSYCFDSWQNVRESILSEADRWLNDQAPHGRTDVFGTISSVLTLPRDPKRPLIALVVTDGEANEGVSSTAAILSRFTALNDGLISLYMYGVKSSANRDLIMPLTRANRGEGHIFNGWRWSAGSELEELTRRMRDPVLSDLRVIPASGETVEIYPRRLRNLYSGQNVEFFVRASSSASAISFSLSALHGENAYDGFFRLPRHPASDGAALVRRFREEEALSRFFDRER